MTDSNTSPPHFEDLSITSPPSAPDVFIITMHNPPENRINVRFAQALISALRHIERTLLSSSSSSSGCVVLTSFSAKFFCTGLDLSEASSNTFANTDGFYPLLATLLDFPFPTVALVTGHTFGGACPLALACDYRIMNSRRGFWSMPPVNLGLHFEGIGALPRLKLRPQIARRMLLEAAKWTGEEALRDGIVDFVVDPRAGQRTDQTPDPKAEAKVTNATNDDSEHETDEGVQTMLEKAVEVATELAPRAKMGVYALLRNELYGEALERFKRIAYTHHRRVGTEARVKI